LYVPNLKFSLDENNPHRWRFSEVTNPRNVSFCNVAQPASTATVTAVVCPTWRDFYSSSRIRHISVSLKKDFYIVYTVARQKRHKNRCALIRSTTQSASMSSLRGVQICGAEIRKRETYRRATCIKRCPLSNMNLRLVGSSMKQKYPFT
jgi:hypothetical protein